MIEPIHQVVELPLLFDEHRKQNRCLDKQGFVNRAGIGMQLSILKESIKDRLISRSKCSSILVPSCLNVLAHYRYIRQPRYP